MHIQCISYLANPAVGRLPIGISQRESDIPKGNYTKIRLNISKTEILREICPKGLVIV